MDKHQRELVAYRDEDVEPRDGLNVVLTLDAALQNIMESEIAEGMRKLSPVSISAVMIRPRTGEILALANFPNFDPNHPGAFPPASLRDRVISDIHDPGSTFKIVVVSGALDQKIVNLSELFDCEHGHFSYAGAVLHDHEAYGMLSVENIITKSSNIGAAKIGIRLGEDTLYHYIRDFGFGQPHRHSAARRSLGHRSSAQRLEQGFHRPNSDGPGRDRHSAANGHGHERHRQQGYADASHAGGQAGGFRRQSCGQIPAATGAAGGQPAPLWPRWSRP